MVSVRIRPKAAKALGNGTHQDSTAVDRIWRHHLKKSESKSVVSELTGSHVKGKRKWDLRGTRNRAYTITNRRPIEFLNHMWLRVFDKNNKVEILKNIFFIFALLLSPCFYIDKSKAFIQTQFLCLLFHNSAKVEDQHGRGKMK